MNAPLNFSPPRRSRPTITGRTAWVLLIGNGLLALGVIYVAWNNLRLVHAWDEAKKAPIRRGCVGVEFSDDQKKWEDHEDLQHPHRFLRLHNYCSSISVSIDTRNGAAFLTPQYPALDVEEQPTPAPEVH